MGRKLEILKNIIKEIEIGFDILLLVLAIVALSTSAFEWFGVHLTLCYYFLPAMQYLLSALWAAANNLFNAFILLILVLYILVIILYSFFRNQLPGHECDTFYRCFLVIIDQTFKVYYIYIYIYRMELDHIWVLHMKQKHMME